jgi:hypothetical protein
MFGALRGQNGREVESRATCSEMQREGVKNVQQLLPWHSGAYAYSRAPTE